MAEAQNLSLAARLGEFLNSNFLEEFTRGLTEQVDSPKLLSSLMELLIRRRRELEELLEPLTADEDEPELYCALSYYWLETRCHWNRLNLIMQYQAVRVGEVQPFVFLSGALISAILHELERFIRPSDRQILTNVAGEPLRFGRPDVGVIESLLAGQLESSTRASQALVEAKSDQTNDPSNHAHFGSLEDAVDDFATVRIDLVWPTILESADDAVGGAWNFLAAPTPTGVKIDVRELRRVREELASMMRRIDDAALPVSEKSDPPSIQLEFELDGLREDGEAALRLQLPREQLPDNMDVAALLASGPRSSNSPQSRLSWSEADGQLQLRIHVAGLLSSQLSARETASAA